MLPGIAPLLLLFAPHDSCRAGTTLELATGREGGVYFVLGRGLAKAIEKACPEVKVTVRPTEGSVMSAELIEAGAAVPGSADRGGLFALVQNDVAYHFVNGEGLFRFPSNRMRGVAALFTEVVQIVARRDVGISSAGQLRGKRVAVGPRMSGTELNAVSVLKAVGLTYKDIDEKFLSFGEAREALLAGKLEAMFVTAGLPTPAVTELGNAVQVVPVDAETQRRLRRANPYFVSTSVPSRTYPGQYAGVPTVGVRALLVAEAGLEDDLVRRVAATVFDRTEEVARDAEGLAAQIRLDSALRGMCIPLHPGAERFYQERGVRRRRHLDRAGQAGAVALSLLLLFLFRRLAVRAVRKSLYLRAGLALVLLVTVGTIATYFFERGANEHFENLGSSFWSSMVYILSGFEDREPVTTGGRLSSILIFLASIGLLGSVAGGFAVGFADWGAIKMPKNIEGQIVICNWSAKADGIVEQLHAPQAEPGTEIVVITDTEINEKELRSYARYENVYFVKGDPVLHDTLRATRVHFAKSVILLADEAYPDPDAKSALIALALKELSDPERNPEVKAMGDAYRRPHVVAEAVNHRKIKHLKDADVDEVVCASDYGLGVLAQCALHASLSHVYEDLLRYTAETCEVYVIGEADVPDIDSLCRGRTFDEIAASLAPSRESENPVILVGIRRGERVVLNPKRPGRGTERDTVEAFADGDALVVVAYDRPDLRGYLSSLAGRGQAG